MNVEEVLESVPRGAVSASSAAPAPAAIDAVNAGTTVGRYVVERALGDGRAAIYQARDPSLDRPAVLELSPAAGEQAARLLDEARRLARLDHPNIVTVLEVGEHAGAVFVAFEHLADEPVWRWLESGQRRIDEIVEVFRDAAAGLAAAHDAGVVHGHLTAAAIRVGHDRRVRVDFGFASAPERGAAPGSPADDQANLARALREALDRAAARSGRARVPARIARAIDRALDPEPGRRWPSMAALAGALELPHRRVIPVVAGSVALAAVSAGVILLLLRPAAQDADRCAWVGQAMADVWGGSHRAAVERSFAPAGPAGAVSAASTLRALDRYARGWVDARTGLCRAARGTSDRLAALTGACLDRRREVFGALVTELGAADVERLRHAVEAAGTLPPIAECAHTQHLVTQSANRAPAPTGEVAALTAEVDRLDARRLLGDHAVAGRVREIAVRAGVLGAHSLASRAWYIVGLSDRETSDPKAELEPLYESVWAAEADGDLIAALLGWIRLVEGGSGADLPRAELERMLAHAEAALERIARVDARIADRYRVELLGAQADFFDEYGSSEQAEAKQREAIALLGRLAGGSTLELAALEHGLGQILIGAARYDEAVEVSTRALARTKELVGDDHPNTMVRHFQLGWALFMRGRHEPALAEVAACRAIARRTGAKVYVAKIAILEAQIEQKRGRPAAAKQALESTLADGSAEALSAFQIHYYLGEAHFSLRDFVSAERAFRLALDDIAKRSPDHSDVAFARTGIGMSLLEQGKAAQAVPFLEAAVKQMEPRQHSERPLAEMRQYLADALWATGERRRARDLVGQVRAFLATLPADLAGHELAAADRWLATHPAGKPRPGRRKPRVPRASDG